MMKNLMLSVLLLPVLLAPSLAFAEASPAEQLASYIKGGDSRNIELIDRVLHNKFLSTFTFSGKEKITTMTKKALLKNYKNGKFGGNPRTFSIQSIVESDGLTLITAETIGSKFKFSGVYVMEKAKNTWQLKNEYLILSPASS